MSLPHAPTLAIVTPRDLCRLLVYKDSKGKTQIHILGCQYLGQPGSHRCCCPVRLSHKTVDSYIGKLRIFHDYGRVGEYDMTMGYGNPATNK